MDLFQLTRKDPVTGEIEPVPAKERIEAIYDMERPQEVIRSMDPQALYTLIYEAGREDAYDLVLLASAEQVQAEWNAGKAVQVGPALTSGLDPKAFYLAVRQDALGR